MAPPPTGRRPTRCRSLAAPRGLIGALLALVCTLAGPARAQDMTASIAKTVLVAIDEYGKGMDATGRVLLQEEYDEAVMFLAEARKKAERLPSERAGARAIIDSLIAAVAAKKPPSEVAELGRRFEASLGSAGQLEMPSQPLNIATGRALYQKECAICHGPTGGGDGPGGRALRPPPPAIGDRIAMHDVTPKVMFAKVSVGVAGTAMTAYEDKISVTDRWNIIAYLVSLRSDSKAVADGEGLFAQSCASCHGLQGSGDGQYARGLSKTPPDVGALPWQFAHSDAEITRMALEGIPGTPMPKGPAWTPAQAASVVAYVRTLMLLERAVTATPATDSSTAGVEASAAVRDILQRAIKAAEIGQTDQASDLAFDAYIAFEPLEARVKPRDPALVSRMEGWFTDFRTQVGKGDWQAATTLRDFIAADMPKVVELSRPADSPLEAFIQSLLIILREGFEAILVVGAVVALLLKTGHRERLRSIWIGVGLGLLASVVTAVVLKTVLASIPASREVIEGVTMLIAVGVLFSVSYWLISKVEAAKWQQFIRDRVNEALEHGGGRALVFVSFLAVYREGAETALFYQALFNEGSGVMLPIVLGIVVGSVILAVIFTLFYRYGVKIPLRPFFAVTSVLLYYMAFVFMGKGIKELQEGNAMSFTIIPGLPSVDAIGFYNTWETLLGQLLMLVLFAFALLKTFWPKRSVALPTVPVAPVPADVGAELARLGERVKRLEERLPR
jgi:high-affinity iron transporter